ncbi:MAG: thioredoxin, partial [Flavobacterium sp.]|nr:thioredoxin [Flavobacterium sp.]
MLILTDENFEKEIQNMDKPVLVDFYALWCNPCFFLTPTLERLAEEYNDRFILIKVNIDEFPLTAQKYSVDRIPQVLLFKNGKPVSGFVGIRPELEIRKWLEENLKENQNQNNEVEKLIREYEDYAKQNGFKLNPDRGAVERIVKGLLENEKKYGQKYCPCRRISGNLAEDEIKICPCHWHK